jgi:CheY-like chemotaxis protein
MPKMDGIELVRRILTQKPGAKVVLMTGPSTVIPADLR